MSFQVVVESEGNVIEYRTFNTTSEEIALESVQEDYRGEDVKIYSQPAQKWERSPNGIHWQRVV